MNFSTTYTIKPFEWKVWLSLFLLLLFTSRLITVVLNKTIRNGDFGYFFGIVKRAFTSLTFQFQPQNPLQSMKIFYLIIIVFGFMVNLWYSALLGSFLITQLKEEPINTIEDFKREKKKILLSESDYRMIETIFDMTHFSDVFEVVDRPYLRYQKNILNTSHSYVEKTDHWKYFSVPLMDFHNDFRFCLTSINLNIYNFYLNINADSLYKEKLNRFLFLIRDVGLYQFYFGVKMR